MFRFWHRWLGATNWKTVGRRAGLGAKIIYLASIKFEVPENI